MNDKIEMCDFCNKPIGEHNHLLSRNIQVVDYETVPEEDITTVLDSVDVGSYCSFECAQEAIPIKMAALGIKFGLYDYEPLSVCCICDGLVDKTKPHVAYEYIEIVVTDLVGEVIHADGVANICNVCDSDFNS